MKELQVRKLTNNEDGFLYITLAPQMILVEEKTSYLTFLKQQSIHYAIWLSIRKDLRVTLRVLLT